MISKNLIGMILVVGTPLATPPAYAAEFTPTANPVFQVDYPSPTADKPQSKLWFVDGCWWALLPRASGPSLWQRTDSGWIEHTDVVRTFSGKPGRADVWLSMASVTAVAVAELDKTNPSIGVFRPFARDANCRCAMETEYARNALPTVARGSHRDRDGRTGRAGEVLGRCGGRCEGMCMDVHVGWNALVRPDGFGRGGSSG